MTPAADILAAVVAALQAATWTPPGGAAQPAFEEVRLFRDEKLEDALKELVAVRSRIALVVWLGRRFEGGEDIVDGPDLRSATRPVAQISVLCADRVVAKSSDALYGTATNPGAIRLAELAAEAVTGRHLSGAHAVSLAPTSEEPLAVNVQATHRLAVVLELEARPALVPDEPDAA